ncbi:MAG: hypothetical protein WCO02_00265 [Bacteroidota bacterium]
MVAAKELIRSALIILVLLTQPLWALSGDSFLSRKISLNIPSCSLETALREIGKAGCFRFSYDADLIPAGRKVDLKAGNSRVSDLLKEILGKEIRPMEIGNHVVLIRNKSAAREKKPYPDIVITGSILDASSREPLKDATVYETENRKSAITAVNGSFKLLIPTGRKCRSLTFCKTGYADTVIFIKQDEEYKIDILLRPLEESLSRLNPVPGLITVNLIDSLGFVNWVVPRMTMVNARNLEVRTSAAVQLSIIPYIGTNWKVTGSVTNRFSLNLLAGYTGGLKGFELGGLLNITRKDVCGLQIGGLGNIVGGNTRGLQVGGLFNYDLGTFHGVQLAGLFNYMPDTIHGLQLGGLVNIIKTQSKAWQVSGLLNLDLKDARKVQLTGLMNYSHNVDGLQLSGLLNIAQNHNDGVQICGLVNYATIVNGLQFGLINISNTVEKGVPIGIFSYVQNGYHTIEVSGNEIFYGNVGFKSGTKPFYTFVQFGMGSDYKLQGSYGIGTIFTLKKKLSMNIDASAGLVYHPTDTVYHGFLLKVNPSLEYRFAKHFAIFIGPAYNFFLFTKGSASATPRGLSPYDFYFESTPNSSIQMWLGGVLGVRF